MGNIFEILEEAATRAELRKKFSSFEVVESTIDDFVNYENELRPHFADVMEKVNKIPYAELREKATILVTFSMMYAFHSGAIVSMRDKIKLSPADDEMLKALEAILQKRIRQLVKQYESIFT